MRSSVPRSSPIVHSIDAIHHLAERLWLLCTYQGPIHQLHHPYSKTSWLPLQPASSRSSGRNNCVSCGAPTTRVRGRSTSRPSARLHELNLFTRARRCDSRTKEPAVFALHAPWQTTANTENSGGVIGVGGNVEFSGSRPRALTTLRLFFRRLSQTLLEALTP